MLYYFLHSIFDKTILTFEIFRNSKCHCQYILVIFPCFRCMGFVQDCILYNTFYADVTCKGKPLCLSFLPCRNSNYNQVLNSVFCRGKNLINSNSLPLWHAPISGLNNFYSYRDHSHFCTNSY